MAKAKFRLKQVDLPHGTSWVGLKFNHYMKKIDDSEEVLFIDPIVSKVCGEHLDYGRLFAYCFRRFGYPERGWDDYKELVRYYLSTPNQNLLLWRIQGRSATRFNEAWNTSWGVLNPSRFLGR